MRDPGIGSTMPGICDQGSRRPVRKLAVLFVIGGLASLTAGPVSAQSDSGPAAARASHEARRYVRVNRYVPHESTVPANAGRRVALFVHETVGAAVADEIGSGSAPEGRVVLFVHGVSVPSVPDFDLAYRDYSWMEYLADAGFDTFSLDQTGYGHSPEPAMDDPCNLSAQDQRKLDPEVVPTDCEPGYAHFLTSSQTDWDELDTVVDYIRELRGVDRVSLLGWSLGGLRAGGYAARHADKLDKVVLYAPFYQRESRSSPPDPYPAVGPPMTLQTKTALLDNRWGMNVACDNQVDPGIREAVWQTIMSFDPLGSVWATPTGVMRVRTASYFGWNAASATRITTPTLILIGEQDGLLQGALNLFEDMDGVDNKVLVRMDCATHFAVWEASQHRFMHEASREWLESGRFRGNAAGTYSVGFGGQAR